MDIALQHDLLQLRLMHVSHVLDAGLVNGLGRWRCSRWPEALGLGGQSRQAFSQGARQNRRFFKGDTR